MKIIKIDLPKEMEQAEIVCLSDLHIGDKNCNIDAIKEKIEYIKAKENRFFILNGDLVNNAVKLSVSDIYSETIPPMKQVNMCYELFKDISHKCLAITSGNHENRTWKESGIEIGEVIASKLGISDRYAPVSALLFIKIGTNKKRERDIHGKQHLYSIYVTHSSGGGKKVGGKANGLEDMSSIVDSDILIRSHTHQSIVFKEAYYRVDLLHQTAVLVDKLFVNTGSFVNYGDNYGEMYGFRPNSLETPHIYLGGVKKEFWAVL